MKTEKEIRNELEVCKKQLLSDNNSTIRSMLVEKISTLKWVLGICNECNKKLTDGTTKSGSSEICDECYEKINYCW